MCIPMFYYFKKFYFQIMSFVHEASFVRATTWTRVSLLVCVLYVHKATQTDGPGEFPALIHWLWATHRFITRPQGRRDPRIKNPRTVRSPDTDDRPVSAGHLQRSRGRRQTREPFHKQGGQAMPPWRDFFLSAPRRLRPCLLALSGCPGVGPSLREITSDPSPLS